MQIRDTGSRIGRKNVPFSRGFCRRVWGAALLFFVVLPAISRGQSDLSLRFDRELQQLHEQTAVLANPAVPADQRALFDYGGYATVSYLSLDDLNRNNHSLRQYDLVGYLDLNFDDVQELFVRGRLEWQDFSPGDAFDGRDHQFHPEIERAYYRFDLAKAESAYYGKTIDNDVAIKAGRQLMYWANGLTISQTLDGGILDLSHGPFAVQVIGGVTLANEVDIDSSRPNFDSNTHRGFYGAMVSVQAGTNKPFAYFLSQQDYNHDFVKTIGAGADALLTHFNYNSNYLGAGSTGTSGDHLAYGIEAVFEGGSSLSNSYAPDLSQLQQTPDRIRAFAGDFRADYLLNDTRRTRAGAEVIFASGDDARDQTTNTFGGAPPHRVDAAFNAFGQVQNGLAFSPNVSNLYIARLGISTFPLATVSAFRQLQNGLDLFFFQKFSRRAPIDEASSDHGYVGFEPDLFLNWQIKSDITLAMRYGAFFPGDAVVSNRIRQFFYTGVTFAF
jgi:hypothetical protein